MKLSEENKEWLNFACIDTYESETERFVYERPMTERKLLEMQQRIDELEFCIDGANQQFRKLEKENAELKSRLKEYGDTYSACKCRPSELAQHDKEVEKQVLFEMGKEINEDTRITTRDKSFVTSIILNKLSELQEQE